MVFLVEFELLVGQFVGKNLNCVIFSDNVETIRLIDKTIGRLIGNKTTNTSIPKHTEGTFINLAKFAYCTVYAARYHKRT